MLAVAAARLAPFVFYLYLPTCFPRVRQIFFAHRSGPGTRIFNANDYACYSQSYGD